MDLAEIIRARAEEARTPAERVAAAVADPDAWGRWVAAAAMHPDLSALGVLSLSELMEAHPELDCTALLPSAAVARRRGRIGADAPYVTDGDGTATSRLYPPAAVGVDREPLAPGPVKVDTALSESVGAFSRAVDSVKLVSVGDGIESEIASAIVSARYGLDSDADGLPAVPTGAPDEVWRVLSDALSKASRDARAIDGVWPAQGRGARPAGPAARRDGPRPEAARDPDRTPRRARPPAEGTAPAAADPAPEESYTPTAEASIESIRRDLATAEKRRPRKSLPRGPRG